MNNAGLIPADILDSATAHMDGEVSKQSFYFILKARDVDRERLAEAIMRTVNTYPLLRAKLKPGLIKDHWVVSREVAQTDYLYVESVDEPDLLDYFLRKKDRSITPGRDYPFKAYLVTNPETADQLVVFVSHHSLGDPSTICQLVEYLAHNYADLHYTGMLPTGNRSLGYLFDQIGADAIAENKRTSLFHRARADQFPALRDNIYDAYPHGPGEHSQLLIIRGEMFHRFYQMTRRDGWSINDALLYLNLLLLEDYNQAAATGADTIYLSLSKNLREYLPKDRFFMCNFSGRDCLVYPRAKVHDKAYFRDQLSAYKQRVNNVIFLTPFYAMRHLPVSLNRLIWSKKVRPGLLDWNHRTITTTNLGRLDRYVEAFDFPIDQACVIAASSYSGFPVVTTSTFRETIVISANKYNDYDNDAQQLIGRLQEQLARYLAGDQEEENNR